jgi:hypothetical protein
MHRNYGSWTSLPCISDRFPDISRLFHRLAEAERRKPGAKPVRRRQTV